MKTVGVPAKTGIHARRVRGWGSSAGTLALYATTLILFAIVGAGLWGFFFARPVVTDGGASAESGVPASIVGGEQLVLVFVGSTSCVWSRTPEVRGALRQAEAALRRNAESRQMGLHRIGVSVAPSPEAGLRLLADVGEFDEVAVGGRWTNAGIQKYVSEGFHGSAATPQLLVLQRRIGDNGRGVYEETLLRRLVGTGMIASWLSGGAVLPSPLGPHSSSP